MTHTSLTAVDWLIMLLYFVFVLGIGFALKRFMKTSKDFFQAGRALPAWICGLAFISANLGAQEVIGMGASGAKYGLATSHFYWIGAIPAMIFVGIFMMPFYYGSKARSVPEFLRLRFDEKTRGLNALTFAAMTILNSGISIYALAKLIQTPTLRPETIMEVAASIDAQAKGIEDAVRFGEAARSEVVTAIVTAQESMSASTQKLSQCVVDLVSRARKPLELPAAPEIPASVLSQAPAVNA